MTTTKSDEEVWRPTLCLDFDGVVHEYTSGWKGIDVVADGPVDGAMQFIVYGLEHLSIHIYSSRSDQEGGIEAMKAWLTEHLIEYWYENMGNPMPFENEAREAQVSLNKFVSEIWAEMIIDQLHFPTTKPKPFLTIDDRAICFDGTWPSYEEIRSFKPWYRK